MLREVRCVTSWGRAHLRSIFKLDDLECVLVLCVRVNASCLHVLKLRYADHQCGQKQFTVKRTGLGTRLTVKGPVGSFVLSEFPGNVESLLCFEPAVLNFKISVLLSPVYLHFISSLPSH